MAIDINGLTTNSANSTRGRSSESVKGSTASADTSSAQTGSESSRDSVSLSPEARVLNKLADKINESPEVDADKVSRLQSAIANGEYQPESLSIADKMLKLDDQL